MNKYIAALSVDKVQTFLTEVIHSHTQAKESEEATLKSIINSSDQIAGKFFEDIYERFPEANANTLMKCSGVFIFSSDQTEETLEKALNDLFVKYYRESQGQKILRWVYFPSEGLDEISAIQKAKKQLKQVQSMNRIIEKNQELLFGFDDGIEAESGNYTEERKRIKKEFPAFTRDVNALRIGKEEQSRFRIAVIKADLDGMGEMFRGIDQYKKYSAISEILNSEICLDGLHEAAKQFKPEGREEWLFPLYIAGDDIFFAVAVEDMLRGANVCRQLMHNVNRKIEESGACGEKLRMSIGVEITFNKEPIRYYMERVERQLKNAKKQDPPVMLRRFLNMRISIGDMTFLDIDYNKMKAYRESLKNDRKSGRQKKMELDCQMQNVPVWNYFISDVKFLNYLRTAGGTCGGLLGRPNFFYTLLEDITDDAVQKDDVKYINHVLYRLEPQYFEHSDDELRQAELVLNTSLIRQLYLRDESGFRLAAECQNKNMKIRFETYLRLMILFSDIRFRIFKTDTEGDSEKGKTISEAYKNKKVEIRRLLFSKPREYLYDTCLHGRSKELTNMFVKKVSQDRKSGYQKVSLERSSFFKMKSVLCENVPREKAAEIIELHNSLEKEKIDEINKKREAEKKLPNRLYFDKQKMIETIKTSSAWTPDYVDSLMLFYSYNEMFMKMKK